MQAAGTSGGGSMRVQVSPKYCEDKLKSGSIDSAIDVYEDRILGWMLAPAEHLLTIPNGEFSALAIALSYFECVNIFIQGESSDHKSRRFFKDAFLRIFPRSETGIGMGGKAITADYQDQVADKLYTMARCGLFHQGMCKRGIFVTDKLHDPFYMSTHTSTLEVGAIFINVRLLIDSLRGHFSDYIAQLRDSKNDPLRTRFKKAWDLTHAGEAVPIPPFPIG